MKKKAQSELQIPDDIKTSVPEDSNSKYMSAHSYDYQKLKEVFNNDLKPLAFESEYKFHEENIDEEDLSPEGFYKLFGLKQIEFLKHEDLLDVKSKMMIKNEYDIMEEEKNENKNIDDLSKEIIYAEYMLQNFVIPENNVRRKRLTISLQQNNSYLLPSKLQEFVYFRVSFNLK